MLHGIAILLCFQAAGEAASALVGHMIPGPILGLILLFSYLVCRGKVEENLEKVTDGLLANMAILFVPGGVGVILYGDVFRDHLFTIALALILGTFATLAVTALVAETMLENQGRRLDWRSLRAGYQSRRNEAQISVSAFVQALSLNWDRRLHRRFPGGWTTELGAIRTPSYAVAAFHPED